MHFWILVLRNVLELLLLQPRQRRWWKKKQKQDKNVAGLSPAVRHFTVSFIQESVWVSVLFRWALEVSTEPVCVCEHTVTPCVRHYEGECGRSSVRLCNRCVRGSLFSVCLWFQRYVMNEGLEGVGVGGGSPLIYSIMCLAALSNPHIRSETVTQAWTTHCITTAGHAKITK